MFCYKCGNKISENAKFCSYCGTSLVGIFNKDTTKETQEGNKIEKDTILEANKESNKKELNDLYFDVKSENLFLVSILVVTIGLVVYAFVTV